MNLHSTPRRVGAALPRPRSFRAGSLRAGSLRVWSLRILLFVGVFSAVLGTATVGDPAPVDAADPELARLLRGMALIKAVLVVAAVGAVWWRFARPLSNRMAAAYLFGVSLAAAGSVMVWRLTFLGLAAGAFHVGELVLLAVAWGDGGRRLGAGQRRAGADQ